MKFIKTVPLERSILLLRWARIFKGLMFILPVVVILYQHKGLSLGDFFLIQSIFSIAVFILEIPTGYIGDLFSRKKVITFAFFIYSFGYFVLFIFDGFLSVLSAEILWGLAGALYSGTGSAYVYDVLKKQDREKDFLKVQGKNKSAEIFGSTIAVFTGGIIYRIFGPDTTLFISFLVTVIAFIMILFLPELEGIQRVVEEGKSKMQDIIDIAKYAYSHKEIKWLMLFPAAFGSGTMMIFWALQPIMENNLIPVALFGFFTGMNQLFRALFSMFGSKIFRKLKTRNFSLLLFTFLALGLIIAMTLPSLQNPYINYFLLLIMSFVAASQAGLSLVTTSMINHRIKSDERATVLSVNSMFGRILMAIIMLSIKFLIDGAGLQAMLITLSPIIIVMTFIAMKKLLKLKIH